MFNRKWPKLKVAHAWLYCNITTTIYATESPFQYENRLNRFADFHFRITDMRLIFIKEYPLLVRWTHPWYQKKMLTTTEMFHTHDSLFCWFWFTGRPFVGAQLYEICKEHPFTHPVYCNMTTQTPWERPGGNRRLWYLLMSHNHPDCSERNHIYKRALHNPVLRSGKPWFLCVKFWAMSLHTGPSSQTPRWTSH